MVAYNFQPEFAAALEAGIKRSTIRPTGKRRHARPGDEVQLYTGMRSPACRLLGRATCIAALPVEIRAEGVCLDGVLQTDPAYYVELARIEGFATFGNLQAWFDRRYGLPVVSMTQIRWDIPTPEIAPDTGEAGAR